MDNTLAFAMGQANRHKEPMVFDWDKAAHLIKERKPNRVSAGLRSDWEYTGGVIFENGKPVKNTYTFLSSTWAVPEIDIDGDIEPCYIMGSTTDWDSDTKWPPSALKILKEKKK